MEALMQYVWQHRLWGAQPLSTVDGQPVSVIDQGRLNRDAGPDFFNAKVKIGDRLWAGDVEMHVRASDWYRHGHHTDAAYNSVILHVVAADDMAVNRGDTQAVIPQLIMACNPDLHNHYRELVDRSDIDLPCSPRLGEVPSLHITSWVDALAFERLNDKAARINAQLLRSCGDWEDAAYVTLARGLGFGLNSEPLERLAKSAPLHFLRKHSDKQQALEAILFGQAGMLHESATTATDSYVASLRLEYEYYRRIFGLMPLQSPGWKLARTRPANLPFRRIAMLAAMIHGGFNLMGRIIACREADDFYKLFHTDVSDYWTHHYTPGGTRSVNPIAMLGRAACGVLAINVAAPLLYAYGHAHSDSAIVDRAVELLMELPAESNRLITPFTASGAMPCRNAFESQALVQLRRNYCEQHKCLYCRLGHRLLSTRALIRQD